MRNLGSRDREFFEEVKKNEEQASQLKDPEAKYQSVIIANLVYFLKVSQCLKFEGQSNEATYDLT